MSPRPTVLLVSPGILKWTDMDFGLPHLVALGGYLEAHCGVRVEIVDLNYEGGDHHSLGRTLDELGPYALIGVSTYSSFDRMRALAVARFLRDRYPGVPILTGGYHASAVPEDLLFEGSPFDAVIVGEAEEPLRAAVEGLLGGTPPRGVLGPGRVPDLDALPPTRWDLLRRYWPRAHQLGRKLQIYLARGCPYRCAFCMERAKSGYSWRPHSPERAVEELRRLASFTDLSRWVVNIADPLFGFQRRWRREVLEGILREGLLPRQYWTLTRSDDLDADDVSLLARARFSIGIGLESGSPEMLRRMNKGNKPEKYLEAVERLARLSHEHGLSWAVNVIVGHPGETPETARETRDFVTRLFTSTPTTRGFLSIDPFRLYPGSAVFEDLDGWEAATGARFYQRDWWRAWYDHGFLAQHLDPSDQMDFAARVRWMHGTYRPLLEQIRDRFVGQDRDVDAVFARSIAGQIEALAPAVEQATLARAAQAVQVASARPEVRLPLGMNQKDPWVRRREDAVRRLLDRGVLRTEALVEALLEIPLERYLSGPDALATLDGRPPPPAAEGLPPVALPLGLLAAALEALEPDPGDTVVDAAAGSPYVAAVLARLVGPTGRVLARHALRGAEADAFSAALAELPQVRAQAVPLAALLDLPAGVDRVLIGAALPRLPRGLVDGLAVGGRVVAFLGPRFRDQDLVVASREPGGRAERVVARARVPILAGPSGWVREPVAPRPAAAPAGVRFSRRAAPAFAFWLLAHLDLRGDAANLWDPALGAPPWAAPLRDAWADAPGRLALHALPLAHASIDALLEALRERPPAALGDAAGRALVAAFLAAADAARPAFEAAWERERDEALRRAAALGGTLGPALARLRERLWEARGAPPPLVILDCPALGRAGRATSVRGERVVAVDLGQPPGHVLCQVLHEEIHPITDPLVLAELGAAPDARDTRAGAPGHAVHQALEQTAIAATEAFLDARAPELLPDFRRWKAIFSPNPHPEATPWPPSP